MWLMTRQGFYSVGDGGDGRVQIRAHQRRDLEQLRDAVPVLAGRRILATPHADYAFRLIVPDDVWEGVLRALAREPSLYRRFKAAVGVTNPERERVYEQVWMLLRDALTADPNGRALANLKAVRTAWDRVVLATDRPPACPTCGLDDFAWARNTDDGGGAWHCDRCAADY